MKILVTGAAGFIGSHLIPRLLSHGHTVTALVRHNATCSDNGKRRLVNLEAIEAQKPRDLRIIRCENTHGLASALRGCNAELCVHLAGRSWVRESIGWPELYVEANYRYTVALAQALSAAGCQRIVFASTVMVYGKDAPLPYAENQLGSFPSSPYGASKLACEALLNTYRALGKLEVINLRLFSVYGPELRQDLVPHLIATAIMKGKPFTVFGDGSSIRDYIEIEDALNAIEAACNVPEVHATLNVGSGFGTSVLELVHLIENALSKKAELVYKPAIEGELAVAIPDISLAMSVLKWEPAVSVESGMARMAGWFQSNIDRIGK
ncbi:MAG TPA: NAD-dependent epimerase/dehydratase family protein [Planctomycetota bacterium]|jgi:UDP-glucuronate 4-epimerase